MCALLGQPPSRGEEITLDLPNAREVLPRWGRNANQKLKAVEGPFGGGFF